MGADLHRPQPHRARKSCLSRPSSIKQPRAHRLVARRSSPPEQVLLSTRRSSAKRPDDARPTPRGCTPPPSAAAARQRCAFGQAGDGGSEGRSAGPMIDFAGTLTHRTGNSFTIPPTKLIHVEIDPEEIGRSSSCGTWADAGPCRARSPRYSSQEIRCVQQIAGMDRHHRKE